MKRLVQSVSFGFFLVACGAANVEPGGNPDSINQPTPVEAESELLEMASGVVENNCPAEISYKIGPSSFTVGANQRTTFSARPGAAVCLMDAARACVGTGSISASAASITFGLTETDCNVLTIR